MCNLERTPLVPTDAALPFGEIQHDARRRPLHLVGEISIVLRNAVVTSARSGLHPRASGPPEVAADAKPPPSPRAASAASLPLPFPLPLLFPLPLPFPFPRPLPLPLPSRASAP